MVSSLLAEIAATCWILLKSSPILLGLLLQVGDDSLDGFVNTALEVHRVGTGSHVFQFPAFTIA
jgi:hypothetical protein